MICNCAPVFKFFYSPPDGASTEYQISNREFSDFLRTYYCDFLVYRQARFFSVVIMGNDKQVLPVSHWLEVVIAFVSSFFIAAFVRIKTWWYILCFPVYDFLLKQENRKYKHCDFFVCKMWSFWRCVNKLTADTGANIKLLLSTISAANAMQASSCFLFFLQSKCNLFRSRGMNLISSVVERCVVWSRKTAACRVSRRVTWCQDE